jgi:hypothetical protein
MIKFKGITLSLALGWALSQHNAAAIDTNQPTTKQAQGQQVDLKASEYCAKLLRKISKKFATEPLQPYPAFWLKNNSTITEFCRSEFRVLVAELEHLKEQLKNEVGDTQKATLKFEFDWRERAAKKFRAHLWQLFRLGGVSYLPVYWFSDFRVPSRTVIGRLLPFIKGSLIIGGLLIALFGINKSLDD